MTTVDWSKPIEAVHTDGSTAKAVFQEIDHEGDYRVSIAERGVWFAQETGQILETQWSIRNVEPTTDEAQRRMEALVDKMASFDAMGRVGAADLRDEARAIQALRAPPVDPRLDLVVRSLVGNGVSRPVAPLFARDVLKALDAAE